MLLFVCIFRSDLIDYNKLTKSNANYNLNNAFNVADERLGLAKLLDAEGMLRMHLGCTIKVQFVWFEPSKIDENAM